MDSREWKKKIFMFRLPNEERNGSEPQGRESPYLDPPPHLIRRRK
jgi:hypothetical protein